MKDQITISLRKVLALSALYLISTLLLRMYEATMVQGRLSDSVGAFRLELMGIGYDMLWTMSIVFPVIVIHILISMVLPRAAFWMSVVLFSLVLFISFGVGQYFITTLLPLSADLYGYSPRDIATTINSSGETSWLVIISMALFAIIWIGAIVMIYRRDLLASLSFPVMISIGCLSAVACFLPHHPSPEGFDNDISYYLSVNKSWFFYDRTKEYIREQNEYADVDKNTYPFLHKREEADHLGQYFNKAEGNPNLVVIIVEGLGRDFTGPEASYPGFTPFIDSLSGKSLYWKNALSNAGRTFGALPSILGSLPYGKEGFMSYGTAMPDHQTLISMLKPHGYTSSFFYGGNPNFDGQDLFLERQGIDEFVDESKFPPSYKKPEQSSWGFADNEVFSFAASQLSTVKSPRLDVYLTLSTHEPFICPAPAIQKIADHVIDTLSSAEFKQTALENKGVFSCLLYTDNAIRSLFRSYQSRADYKNTIFIITGDHRLIPLPPGNKIKRFHVPLLIYSPLLKEPKAFESMAIHSSIMPTLINFLATDYGLSFPSEIASISNVLTPSSQFSSTLDLALIRNKNDIREYLQGEYFLSDERLYKISAGMTIQPVEDREIKEQMIEKLKRFKVNSAFACEYNRVDRNKPSVKQFLFTFSPKEEEYLQMNNISKLTADQQFFKARDLAFQKNYPHSRTILKWLLNKSPNYHDARILLARTYAWAGSYDSAAMYIDQTMKRSPNYIDSYVALCDMQFWQGQRDSSWQTIVKGLRVDSVNVELLSRKARALLLKGDKEEARNIVAHVLKVDPQQELALDLRQKLK